MDMVRIWIRIGWAGPCVSSSRVDSYDYFNFPLLTCWRRNPSIFVKDKDETNQRSHLKKMRNAHVNS